MNTSRNLSPQHAPSCEMKFFSATCPCNMSPRVYTDLKGVTEHMGLFAEIDLQILPFLSRTSDHFDLTVLQAISSCLPVLVTQESGIGHALRKNFSRRLSCARLRRPWNVEGCHRAGEGEKSTLRFGEATALRAAWYNAYPWTKQCAEALKWILKVGSNNQHDICCSSKLTPKPRNRLPFVESLQSILASVTWPVMV